MRSLLFTSCLALTTLTTTYTATALDLNTLSSTSVQLTVSNASLNFSSGTAAQIISSGCEDFEVIEAQSLGTALMIQATGASDSCVFNVTLPSELALNVKVANGALQLSGDFNNADAFEVSNGDVSAQGTTGSLFLTGKNSRIGINGHFGTLRVKTVNRSIVVTKSELTEKSKNILSAINGNIVLSKVRTEKTKHTTSTRGLSIRASSVNGTKRIAPQRVGPYSARVALKTINGDIKVK